MEHSWLCLHMTYLASSTAPLQLGAGIIPRNYRKRHAPYNRAVADPTLERTLASLPPDLKEEVADFAAFLLAKHASETGINHEATGTAHPLGKLAGVRRDEPLSDEDLLPDRTAGRRIEF